MTRRPLGAGALLLVCVMSVVAQQDVIDTFGTHVVQEGETLSGITQYYLGDSVFWRENWKLNPSIDDPDRLKLGQVLNVIVERQIIAQGARINTVANDVDKNLQRSEWQPAEVGDQLIERDGIRTLRGSSAELQFNNNSTLRLGEYSQVFLETKETTLRGVDRGRIEVREGSAELVFEPINNKKTEIELVTGNSVATAQADATGRGQLRTAASDDGAAQVMVYEGSSQVSASGAAVQVPRGYGTAVMETGPPQAPEKLLAPPSQVSAGVGEQWRVANEIIEWQPVAGAVNYEIEICRDPECGDLVLSESTPDSRWQPVLPQMGEFFFRVSAVSRSRLRGYSSIPQRVILETEQADIEPPAIAVVPTGFRHWQDGQWLLGPASELRLEVADFGVGLKSVQIRWNDQDWQRWEGGNLRIPATATRLEVRALDQFDQANAALVEFVVQG